MKLRNPIVICVAIILLLLTTAGTSNAAKRSKSSDVIINVVGDIHGESAIKREAIPGLKKYFADGNLNIFNLETAVTDHDKKEEKEYNFKTNLAFLKTLRSTSRPIAINSSGVAT